MGDVAHLTPWPPGWCASVDDFRKSFIVPCPAGFRRTGCRVQVDEIGVSAYYVATDCEDANPMGASAREWAR